MQPEHYINNSQNSSITFRCWQACDKVHGDMGPWPVRNGKGAKDTSGGTVRHLTAGTDRDVFPGVSRQGGPPEVLLQEG